uniref:Large ribosomal subunit protein uL30-like ferredoxin-like fold domain-containing protein n=1 Tax=Lotus japonicus TaxID=34305 RepID=I3STJ3_LOTJA|nr:unknown [Lotus japonicus]
MEKKKNKKKRKRSLRVDMEKFQTIMYIQRPLPRRKFTLDEAFNIAEKKKKNNKSNSEANKFTLTLTKNKSRRKASGFFFFKKTIWNIPCVHGQKMKQVRLKYRKDWKKFGLKKFFIIKGMVMPNTGGKVLTGAVMIIPPAIVTSNFKPVVIIQIQGKKYIHPITRKVLFSLGLRRLFSAVFVKSTEQIMSKLQRVAPYVTYGYPNLESIKELLYKKGHAKIDERKVSLTDSIIGQELGKFGILCMEDMVHQIYNVGPHFKEVVRFIWPFELNKPSDGFKGSKTLFKNGGDAGNREDSINELINKMMN